MRRFVQQLLQLRRNPWEIVASALIAVGIFCLMQPFWIGFYQVSFLFILIGTILFNIVVRFRD